MLRSGQTALFMTSKLYRSHPTSDSTSSTMNSPNRPPTPQSVHSWWSDSNSIGPTISIHAAAKPLMRLMYHRQVRSFIKRNQDTPITPELMEICLAYLSYKYILPTTKSLILKELATRVELYSHRDASLINESMELCSSLVLELLASSNTQIRWYTWHILNGSVQRISSLFPVVIICSSDSDRWIRQSARRAFMKCIQTSEGLDCCWDQLSRENISIPVKCFILSEIAIRISPGDAPTMARQLAPEWSLIAEFLASPEEEMRVHGWNILRVAIPSYNSVSWALPRAVSAFSDPHFKIRESAGIAFIKCIQTSEGLDWCWNYLADNGNISSPVQNFILREMAIRLSPEDAPTIARQLAPGWSLVAGFLASPDEEIRVHGWNILPVAIPSYNSVAWALPRTISASRDPHSKIREFARLTFIKCVQNSEGLDWCWAYLACGEARLIYWTAAHLLQR
ncbi:hypothetical protein R3P38DRAFT_1190155 [Favolaschia claudopus]|uniref:Uncharacterized protein n=1 Tax=Favolaschia claudopus TaxID=2862362 RepID=A0AAW0E0Q7_9AGAR